MLIIYVISYLIKDAMRYGKSTITFLPVEHSGKQVNLVSPMARIGFGEFCEFRQRDLRMHADQQMYVILHAIYRYHIAFLGSNKLNQIRVQALLDVSFQGILSSLNGEDEMDVDLGETIRHFFLLRFCINIP